MNTQQNIPSKALKIIMWTAIIASLFGELFKVQHWPGASILLIVGTFMFICFYLPLFVLENWKSKLDKKSKRILIWQVVILCLLAIGVIFKIQRWPWAGLFNVINNWLLLVVVLPYFLFHLIKSSKSDIEKSHLLFITIYFFSYFISLLVGSSAGKVNIDAVLQQGINTEEALRTSTSRNKQLYSSLNSVTNKNTTILDKTTKLKKLVDTTIFHIASLKSHLVSVTDKIPKSQADTLTSLFVENKVNSDVPTHILIGDEFNLLKNKESAYALKQIINNFRDSILKFVQEQNRTIIDEGLNLRTNNYQYENGDPLSWEVANFYMLPLVYVFNTLTNLQYEVKNAEYQVLTDVINSDNKELNTALFSQLADLNSKFDAAKKQKEIASLKEANSRGLSLLNAKDSELADSEQIIIRFALVVVVFIMLVFFVIRSNYLRKQANKTLSQQKEVIERQKHLVEIHQKEIIDSITYAKRLQDAILPPLNEIRELLPNSFILFKPKDIVAGDFYWAEHVVSEPVLSEAEVVESKVNNYYFIAAADCTGHGVPGAMVSMVCSNALMRTVNEFGITDTGKVLDNVRELVLDVFKKSGEDIKDGMDISLCRIEIVPAIDEQSITKHIQWSGANNPLWYFYNNELIEIKADKQPIGKYEHAKPFTTHNLSFEKEISLYMFTDGYADQFSADDKKMTKKKFKELVLSSQNKTMTEQEQMLDNFFMNWKGISEQVDDVCVIGIKLS